MAEHAARAQNAARSESAERERVARSGSAERESAGRAENMIPIESTARAENAISASVVTASAERLQSEAALWPWIGRFLWSPALDLHPSRRESLLPGWPAEVWSDARALEHVSRYLLSSHGLLEPLSYDSTAADFLLALLPQTPLARLARRVGMALHGATACESLPTLDEDDQAFLTKRLPLYWHVKPVEGSDPDATGWSVLRTLTTDQPDGVKRRFIWKTPLDGGHPAETLPGAALLNGLVRKVLKELESPWSSLFATLRRPGCQIRLHG